MERALGQYRILDRLGEGGLGEVFRARDTRLGRTVLVKCVPPAIAADPGRRARLMDAVGMLRALSHPRVAELSDVVEEDGELCLVFEYAAGESLSRVAGGRPLNPRRAAELAAQIADALAEAHALGILHRDLRPDSIILSAKGQVKVLDTGLGDFTRAGALRAQAASVWSHSVELPPGTLAYISPEQALGEPEDARTDIFSLGAILYEMLTGQAPFGAGRPADTVIGVLKTTPPAPGSRTAGAARELDAVVTRMLAKSLDRRYASAAAVAADLRDAAGRLESQAASAPVASREPSPGASRSRRVAAALGIAVVIAVLLWWFHVPLMRLLDSA